MFQARRLPYVQLPIYAGTQVRRVRQQHRTVPPSAQRESNLS